MISDKWMFALKLFLPSWNFFNDFDVVPRLEFQLVRRNVESSDWQPLYANHSTRSLWRMLFNPQGNLELLEKSLIDRATTELSQAPTVSAEFARSEDCEVLTRIARSRIQQVSGLTQAGSFRFRLVTGDAAAAGETLFVSAEHPLNLANR